jgi:thiamine pyrophosphate-dependent acetolactate synthase large subunit-like protein
MTEPTSSTPHNDLPVPGAPGSEFWGSDAIAQCLREMQIPYLALNPGASYRGLHDSLVNHLGNHSPQMLLCLHEEVAIAIAHGYAKTSGRMMGAVVHSNVGLMHATMAVFNAWCDRAPVLMLGATGPWDAARRRPWIDWIHTAADQGALVRDYTKWDNQPGSIPAAIEALLRGSQIAQTAPRGPVYINLDAALQEQKTGALVPTPDVRRYAPPVAPPPAPSDVARAADLLSQAQRPVILMGRMSRSETDWQARVRLAETLQAPVITDLKTGAVFPTDQAQHVGPPGNFMPPAAIDALREADVVLMLDWIDPGGAFKQAFGNSSTAAQVIHVSLDAHSHRGWSMDMGSLPPADVFMLCEPDAAVAALNDQLKPRPARTWPAITPLPPHGNEVLGIRHLAQSLDTLPEAICLVRLPLGWNGAYRHFRHPLDYLGADGGGGVGAGPGNAVGTALALRDMGSQRVAVAMIGDGDFLMGNTAIWTAVHYGIPLLVIVCNNHSFFNDELHQERVAKERGRPIENKWIGQRMDGPEINIAAMAQSMGATAIGPVRTPQDLDAVILQGWQHARQGKVCVIDACIAPGYDANMSGQATASHKR